MKARVKIINGRATIYFDISHLPNIFFDITLRGQSLRRAPLKPIKFGQFPASFPAHIPPMTTIFLALFLPFFLARVRP